MKPSTELVHYDAACRSLALATSFDEVKKIRDQAEAIRVYARQLRNKKLEIQAVKIRARAERRWGQLYKPSRKAKPRTKAQKGKKGFQRRSRETTDVPTLAEMKVSKDVSSRAQKLAELSDEAYEQKVAVWEDRVEKENERVTVNILKVGDRRQKHVRGTFGTSKNEWHTPVEHIERARLVLGAIDLDPASSDLGQKTVKAERFLTPIENGLEREWSGRVWLNPPYSQPDVGLFVSKLVSEIKAERVTAAILLTHNYTDTAWFHEAAGVASAICFTRGRVKFLDEKGKVAAPTQGQAFFYFGADVKSFAKNFRAVGFIVCRYD